MARAHTALVWFARMFAIPCTFAIQVWISAAWARKKGAEEREAAEKRIHPGEPSPLTMPCLVFKYAACCLGVQEGG